jgi:hypothetical protein
MRYWQQYRLIKDPREEAGARVSCKETLESGVSKSASADFGTKIGSKYEEIGAEISAQLKLSVTVSKETTVEETHTFQTFDQPWKWALWEVFDVYETSGDYCQTPRSASGGCLAGLRNFGGRCQPGVSCPEGTRGLHWHRRRPVSGGTAWVRAVAVDGPAELANHAVALWRRHRTTSLAADFVPVPWSPGQAPRRRALARD